MRQGGKWLCGSCEGVPVTPKINSEGVKRRRICKGVTKESRKNVFLNRPVDSSDMSVQTCVPPFFFPYKKTKQNKSKKALEREVGVAHVTKCNLLGGGGRKKKAGGRVGEEVVGVWQSVCDAAEKWKCSSAQVLTKKDAPGASGG